MLLATLICVIMMSNISYPILCIDSHLVGGSWSLFWIWNCDSKAMEDLSDIQVTAHDCLDIKVRYHLLLFYYIHAGILKGHERQQASKTGI